MNAVFLSPVNKKLITGSLDSASFRRSPKVSEKPLKLVVEPNNSSPRNIKRVLEKDVIPAIGVKQIAEVTVTDILAITDRIKAREADQIALQTRNVMKRLFAYAIAREKVTFNPAAAIEAKFIATARSRDAALTPNEVRKLLRAIYQSSMKRAHKLNLFRKTDKSALA